MEKEMAELNTWKKELKNHLESIHQDDENEEYKRKRHYAQVLGPKKGRLFSPSPPQSIKRKRTLSRDKLKTETKEVQTSHRNGTKSSSVHGSSSANTIETNTVRQSDLKIDSKMVQKSGAMIKSIKLTPSPQHNRDDRKSTIRS